MKVKNVLVKVSGDVIENDYFKKFVINLAKKSFVVVVVGGGTEISERLSEAGYKVIFDDIHGRITESWEERKIAREVLEKNSKVLQDFLLEEGFLLFRRL